MTARPPRCLRAPLVATACLAVLAVTALAAADKRTDGKPAPAGYVRLVHVATGKVLAIADDAEEAGAKAVVARDDPANLARQWKVEKDGDLLKITNRKTGKVLDVFEASREDGAAIIQWDEKADDTDNQRWLWVGDGAERRLKGKASDLALDVDADGHVIQKKVDPKAKSQLWRLVEVRK